MSVTPKSNRNTLSYMMTSESLTSAMSEDSFHLLCLCFSVSTLFFCQPLSLNSRVPKTTGIWPSATEAL